MEHRLALGKTIETTEKTTRKKHSVKRTAPKAILELGRLLGDVTDNVTLASVPQQLKV